MDDGRVKINFGLEDSTTGFTVRVHVDVHKYGVAICIPATGKKHSVCEIFVEHYEGGICAYVHTKDTFQHDHDPTKIVLLEDSSDRSFPNG